MEEILSVKELLEALVTSLEEVGSRLKEVENRLEVLEKKAIK